MTTDELQRLADAYEANCEVELEYTSYLYEKRTAAYQAGFLKALELVQALIDSEGDYVFYHYPTSDYSSQTRLREIMQHIKVD